MSVSDEAKPAARAVWHGQGVQQCMSAQFPLLIGFVLLPYSIDIGIVNKYYDLALAGDKMAANHYQKLAVGADACLGCGHCDRRCPFKVKQQARMKTICEYFRKGV